MTSSHAYRALIVQSSQHFASAATALRDAVLRNDLPEARRQWAIAQYNFDLVRSQLTDRSTTELSMAGRLQDQPFFIGRTGLHAVEADLFGASTTTLRADAETLVTYGTVLEFGLLRAQRTPSAMLLTTVENLGWTVTNVLDHPQELYARCNLLDVAASIDLATSVLNASKPIAELVSPHEFATATRRLADLQATLRAATTTQHDGVNTTPDTAVSAAQWRLLAVRINALMTPLSALSGDLDGYGTGRTYA